MGWGGLLCGWVLQEHLHGLLQLFDHLDVSWLQLEPRVLGWTIHPPNMEFRQTTPAQAPLTTCQKIWQLGAAAGCRE